MVRETKVNKDFKTLCSDFILVPLDGFLSIHYFIADNIYFYKIKMEYTHKHEKRYNICEIT